MDVLVFFDVLVLLDVCATMGFVPLFNPGPGKTLSFLSSPVNPGLPPSFSVAMRLHVQTDG